MKLQHSIIALLFLLATSAGPVLAGPAGNPSPITIRVINDPDCLDAGGAVDVHFAAETSLTDIDDWHWNFGDGQTSGDMNPTHSYTYAGSFTVSLTVSSVIGNYHHTVTQADFVQVNDLMFQDDFEDFTYSDLNWVHFKSHLWRGTAIEFALAKAEEEDPDHPFSFGQTSGDIICLGPGGDEPFALAGEPNGRFRLDLELQESSAEELQYTALQLLDGAHTLGSTPVVNLRVRKSPGRFDVQIVGATHESDWIRLANGPGGARLAVELDWYPLIGSYDVALEARVLDHEENGAPVHLLTVVEQLAAPPSFDALLLGVIGLDTNSSESVGQMRVDTFRACRFDYRPSTS